MGGGRGRGRGNKRGRTQRRDFKDGRANEWKKSKIENDGDAATKGWEPFVLESSAFELYYKKQGIVEEEEWDEFMATLRKPLPTTFRINAIGQFASDIRTQLQRDFYERLKDGVDAGDEEGGGGVVHPIRPLAWYPHDLAWQLGYSRTQLRRVPILEKIHEFLKRENEIGSITRQEAVSMVPPLLLDVQPHHRVLDMCAAPGSKTFQLLEMVHSTVGPGEIPQGMVIANDSDVQRCHLLVHQTKRMCSPNILVTNHEAQRFPGLKDADGGLMFDRILCDVPCSGDGTVRKAPDIWKKWNAGVANGLHRLQIQIAMRGVALLKVGGVLVYSTCSLNPIEDEAVVSAILRESGGSMELLDMSDALPELKRRPGMKSWRVRDHGLWLSSASQVNMHRAGNVVVTMFPSGRGFVREAADNFVGKTSRTEAGNGSGPAVDGGKESHIVDSLEAEEDSKDALQAGSVKGSGDEKRGSAGDRVEEEPESEVSDLPLERCMRILPHDQDTGGFFIAVLRKVSPWPNSQKGSEQFNAKQRISTLKEDTGLVPEVEADETAQDEAGSHLSQLAVTADGEGGTEGETPATEEPLSSVQELQDPHGSEENGAVSEAPDLLEGGATVDNVVVVQPEGDTGANLDEKPKGKLQQQGRWRGVDPVLLLQDEGVIKTLTDYYGIKDSFPLQRNLITRSEDSARLKRIYFVGDSVRKTIEVNYSSGQPMKITSAGLQLFERQQSTAAGISPCAFRIVSEGLPTLLPHMGKQIVQCRSRKDFGTLLSGKGIPFHAFEDPSFVATLQDLHIGCCVITLVEPSGEGADTARPSAAETSRASVGCWRGRHTVNLLLTKAEAGQMLERLSLGFTEENPSCPAPAADEELEDAPEPEAVVAG